MKNKFVIIVLVIISFVFIKIFFTFIPELFFIKTSVVDEADSPNNKYTAYTTMRNGGATTLESYQLKIVPKSKNKNNDKYIVLSTYNQFQVEWINETNILVTIKLNSYKSDIMQQEDQIDGIHIDYVYINNS